MLSQRQILGGINYLANTWAKKTHMLSRRAYLSSVEVNGKIYVIGGSLGLNDVLANVEEYDPETDTWTKKADMPTARAALSTSVVNGKVYAIGGSAIPIKSVARIVPALSTVEEYDTGFVPAKGSSSVRPKGKLAKPWSEIKSR